MPRELPTATLSLHPEAALVPEMLADQYERFLADVRVRGILQPIELLPGTQTVIEGRTRLKAATDAGLKSVPVVDADLRGDSPVVYMLRAAVLRRQMTSSQAAAVAVELEERFAAEAKERQREGGRKAGRGRPKAEDVPTPPPTPAGGVSLASIPGFPSEAVTQLATKGVVTVADLDAHVAEIRKKPGRASATRYIALTELELPRDMQLKAGDALVDWEAPTEKPAAKSRDLAAAIAGSNTRYLTEAKKIKKEAPEVFAKVKAGAMTLSEAKRVVTPTPAKPKPKKDDQVRATIRGGPDPLAPCPFCGSAKVTIAFAGKSWGKCETCSASGPLKAGIDLARLAWNQRSKNKGDKS